MHSNEINESISQSHPENEDSIASMTMYNSYSIRRRCINMFEDTEPPIPMTQWRNHNKLIGKSKTIRDFSPNLNQNKGDNDQVS